jgi:hypothetical protein
MGPKKLLTERETLEFGDDKTTSWIHIAVDRELWMPARSLTNHYLRRDDREIEYQRILAGR